jgi:osmotically-inducible protein OsmY
MQTFQIGWVVILASAFLTACSKGPGDTAGGSPASGQSGKGYSASAAAGSAKGSTAESSAAFGNSGGVTMPGDQAASEADRNITAAIRRSIVIERGPDQHSYAARNVQILARDGDVTLRGTVRSDLERADLERRAKDTEGVTAVHNQLRVEAPPTRRNNSESKNP